MKWDMGRERLGEVWDGCLEQILFVVVGWD